MNRDFASSCLNPILYIHRTGNLQITTMKNTQRWFIQYLDNPLIDGRKEGAFPRDRIVGTELSRLNWSTDLNTLKMATFTRQKKKSGSCPTGNFLKSTNSTSSQLATFHSLVILQVTISKYLHTRISSENGNYISLQSPAFPSYFWSK